MLKTSRFDRLSVATPAEPRGETKLILCKFLTGAPLQNLVMKCFPQFSPVLLRRGVGLLG